MQPKQLYTWLLPTEHPVTATRYYEAPLRRPLFHHAHPGNEETIQQHRNSVAREQERRRSSLEQEGVAEAAEASAPQPATPKQHPWWHLHLRTGDVSPLILYAI